MQEQSSSSRTTTWYKKYITTWAVLYKGFLYIMTVLMLMCSMMIVSRGRVRMGKWMLLRNTRMRSRTGRCQLCWCRLWVADCQRVSILVINLPDLLWLLVSPTPILNQHKYVKKWSTWTPNSKNPFPLPKNNPYSRPQNSITRELQLNHKTKTTSRVANPTTKIVA